MALPLQTVSWVFDWLARLLIMAAGALLLALVAALTWMVFGRYVLNDTPTWVERGAQLVILWVVLPVAAVGVRERFHMAVELLPAALPPAARSVLAAAVELVLCGLGILMAYWGWVLVENHRPFRIPLLGLSQGWQFAPLSLAGVLISLFAIEAMARRIAGLPPISAST